MHVLLFYLFFVSWVMIDLIVGMLKTIFIHSTPSTNAFSKVFAWADLLLAGLIIVGAADAPGGLAFFWSSQRKRLLMTFAALFVIGALWQVIAFFTFSPEPGSPKDQGSC